jgi:uncharacterized protein (DUF111 family)
MKVLYFDCFSGISGDMAVGALCDLGVKPSTLEWELSKLDLGEFHMHFEREKRSEIEGVKFGIHEGATHSEACEHEHEHEHDAHGHAHQPHSHAHEHAPHEADAHEHSHGDCCGHDHAHHGHSHSHSDAEKHEHGHAHEHDHSHDHDAHGHSHSHGHDHSHDARSHADIQALIQKSDLSPFVKKHALSIFQRIAVAEAKIHGTTPEAVHFHEVGALDSIADIVCVCVGLEALGVEAVYVSELEEGRGWIKCQHGKFPLPAPATLEILSGIPLHQGDETHELITPTGAAIVAEFGRQFGKMPALRTERIGYGVGTRHLASRPNVLRAVLGELAE